MKPIRICEKNEAALANAEQQVRDAFTARAA